MIRPKALERGDVIGLVAPASPFSREAMHQGMEALESMGFSLRYDESIFEGGAFLAGDDERRAGELMAMFADAGIDGIFSVRGGYGSARILDRLDADVIRKNPKVLVGYSDITALLNYLLQKAGVIAFHGPLVTEMGRMDGPTSDAMLRAVTSTEPLGAIRIPGPGRIRGGAAEGPLVGGSLTLIANSLGTPYELDTSGKILLLEEIGERPYRVDRLLTHLRMAGIFDDAAGVVLGEFVDCTEPDSEGGNHGVPVEEILGDVLDRFDGPVLAGLPVGHGRTNITLPLGVHVRLDADNGTLEFLEPACSASKRRP